MGNTGDLLYTAKTEEQISRWVSNNYVFLKKEKIVCRNRKFLIAYGDVGSGTTRVAIITYLFEKGEWKLLFVRFTNTSTVKAKYDENENSLVFISKSGLKLLVQPLDGASLAYDRKEQ